MNFGNAGVALGRAWNPAANGPSIITLRDGRVIDITSKTAPSVRDICEMDDPAAYVAGAEGTDLGAVDDITAASVGDLSAIYILAPCDTARPEHRRVPGTSTGGRGPKREARALG